MLECGKARSGCGVGVETIYSHIFSATIRLFRISFPFALVSNLRMKMKIEDENWYEGGGAGWWRPRNIWKRDLLGTPKVSRFVLVNHQLLGNSNLCRQDNLNHASCCLHTTDTTTNEYLLHVGKCQSWSRRL